MNASLGVQIFGSQPFFDNTTGAPIALGYVITKLANTATLAGTFADAALTTPNPNSNTLASTLRLTAAGKPQTDMYFSPVNGTTAGVSYDLYLYDANQVLVDTIEDVIVPVPSATGNATDAVVGYGSPTTLTIAGGLITPTKNFHLISPEGGAADNLDTIAVTNLPDGAPFAFSNTNGAAAITVRNGVGNIFTSDGLDRVLSTTAQILQLIRSGANVREVSSDIASSGALGNDVVNGRVTILTGVPVPTADVPSSSGTILVYFTPYKGNSIDLYNVAASAWQRFTFAELSRAVPAAANGLFDVFVFLNAGLPTLWIDISLQWTSDAVRSTALVLQNGVLVMSGSPQYRYVGTICTSSTSGRAIDTYAERKVYNYYNRVKRPVRRLYGDTTWAYSVAAYEFWNGSGANTVSVLQGWQEDSIDLNLQAFTANTGTEQVANASIAVAASATPLAGVIGQTSGHQPTANEVIPVQASLSTLASLGLTNYAGIFRPSGVGTSTWYGVSAGLIQSGLSGSVMG